MTKKMIVLGLIIYSALGFTQEQNSLETKKGMRRSTTQVYAMVATWREISQLSRTDGVDFNINSLNTAGKLGLSHYMAGGKYSLRYGLVLGHSGNDSAVEDFAYFQRSVLLAGLEFGAAIPFFLSPGVELNLGIGGLFRTIKHSVPGSQYQFNTTNRFLPCLALEYLWRLSQSVYWRQSVGTQGGTNDTMWSSGFGYDW